MLVGWSDLQRTDLSCPTLILWLSWLLWKWQLCSYWFPDKFMTHLRDFFFFFLLKLAEQTGFHLMLKNPVPMIEQVPPRTPLAPRIPLPSPATQVTPQTGSFRGKRRESPQNNGFRWVRGTACAGLPHPSPRRAALPGPARPQGRGHHRALTGQRRPPGCPEPGTEPSHGETERRTPRCPTLPQRAGAARRVRGERRLGAWRPLDYRSRGAPRRRAGRAAEGAPLPGGGGGSSIRAFGAFPSFRAGGRCEAAGPCAHGAARPRSLPHACSSSPRRHGPQHHHRGPAGYHGSGAAGSRREAA